MYIDVVSEINQFSLFRQCSPHLGLINSNSYANGHYQDMISHSVDAAIRCMTEDLLAVVVNM